MGLRFRKPLRLGPVTLHVTQRGLSSWSIKLGPWSWNSRHRRQRVNLPGPWHWTGRRSRKDNRGS
ncbi:uncharacterized protein DUF4236 [Halopolyspora algeriensis]|uniref:Uncharacterized protein DUF4236 n=1 Tax=Halopolyspora algeriensis TaxID=1500506 RepID=A0A368VYN0_9ACTN|nr:DUF4236 domain-containing protein [Halopolyspora algeriensis]RCW45932.1 uncharacterized protein DUF4236 [Halopolyspora algeriensis]TQM55345.1 uncharacterized protein DUF4236 [Halopolyspora algeriensis]